MFPATTTAVGITAGNDENYLFYAPFGLSDALNMVVKPNRRLTIPEVYEAKVRRWKSIWEDLTVYSWNGNLYDADRPASQEEELNDPQNWQLALYDTDISLAVSLKS